MEKAGRSKMNVSIDFRNLVISEIEKRKETALMFSGGVDSSTILAAMLECGVKPDLYTFYLQGSKSKDIKIAREISKEFDLNLNELEIPSNFDALVSDIKSVIRICRRTSKAHVQCAHPWIYLSSKCKQDGHSSAMIGMSADGLYGTNRKGAIIYKTKGEDEFRKYRAKKDNDYLSSDSSVFKLSKHFGVQLWDLYAQYSIGGFLLSLTYDQMHKPIQKAVAINAFPEFWKRGNWIRLNSPLQIESGLREFHDQIIKSSLNKRESKTVLGVYNDIAKEMNIDVKISDWHLWEGER
jgi:hypothetical protein